MTTPWLGRRVVRRHSLLLDCCTYAALLNAGVLRPSHNQIPIIKKRLMHAGPMWCMENATTGGRPNYDGAAHPPLCSDWASISNAYTTSHSHN